MPPPLAEEEDSPSADEIPYRDAPENGADVVEVVDVAGDDVESADNEEAVDEYVVEKILRHDYQEDGTLLFEVKWLGYEDVADRTWETEENLATASDVLKAYFKKIGGRPADKPAVKGKKSKKRGSEAVATATPPTAKSGRKRSKLSTPPESATAIGVTTSTRKGKKDSIEDDWQPPLGSWETNVVGIDTIEEAFDPEFGKLNRFAYVMWDNGRKTRHVLPTLNLKCPQKMLNYYEGHLVFRTADSVDDGAPVKAEEQRTEATKAKAAKMVK